MSPQWNMSISDGDVGVAMSRQMLTGELYQLNPLTSTFSVGDGFVEGIAVKKKLGTVYQVKLSQSVSPPCVIAEICVSRSCFQ